MAVFSDPPYTVNLTGRVMHYGQHDAPSLATVNEPLYLGRTLLRKLSSCTMRAENFHIALDKDTSFETYQINRQLEKKICLLIDWKQNSVQQGWILPRSRKLLSSSLSSPHPVTCGLNRLKDGILVRHQGKKKAGYM